MASPSGRFLWYDLMTTDMAAAAAFYREVVGWDARDSGMPDRSYSIFSMGATAVAGLMPIPDDLLAAGIPPCWSGYVGVADVDDYADRVEGAGGTIRKPPTDIPGIGRYSVVADPYGAVFILFKGSSAQGPEPAAPGAPGHIGWHELHAGEGEGAFAFYSKLFGWSPAEAHDMGPMGKYQTFAAGGAPLGGMMTRMPDSPGPFWAYYFNVDGIDAAKSRVERSGGRVLNGPMEVPGGLWVLQAIDPQGAFFALLAPRR